MKNYFFMPPLKKASGGMAVISQIASQLYELGYEVSLVTNEKLPSDLDNPYDIPVIRLNEIRLFPEDRWIVPEGWPALLEPGLKSRAKCAAYVQNWAFLLGRLPPNISWSDLPVSLFAVSNPVAKFITQTTGKSAPIINPGINSAIYFPIPKKDQGKTIKIAWMPRKNKHLALQIKTLFEAIIIQKKRKLPIWITIDNMTRDNVAKAMQNIDIFLATGFPEGFGLPPLEAMACGCLVAGFTGMGGWEYMRNALPHGFMPLFSLPDVPWGPNGFYAADGDVWGAALALEAAYDAFISKDTLSLINSGIKASKYYNKERQKKQIIEIWENTQFWK